MRPEATASLSGEVFLCAGGSNITATPAGSAFDPSHCLAPPDPLPIPFPVIGVTGSCAARQASSFGLQILVSVAGVTRGSSFSLSNGDEARSVTGRSIGGYHCTYDQWLEPGSVRVRAGDNAAVVCHLGPGALINSVSCAD